MMNAEAIVIGAGPAGIAAAVQLKRYDIDCLLFEKDRPGGLLKNAHWVENYPGFPGGISGPQLVELLREHLDIQRITPVRETVETVEYLDTGACFRVTGTEAVYYSQTVIAAAGTTPKPLDMVETLPAELRKNAFYEVYPIRNEREKTIVIVGAGDAAFDYALNLSAHNDVKVVNRGDREKALPLLVRRAAANTRITYLKNTTVSSAGRGENGALEICLSSNDGEEQVDVDYLVAAVGRVPQRDFYTPALTARAEALKEKGLFYEIGDAANGIFRQASIAVGNGIRIAMKIAKLRFGDCNEDYRRNRS